MKILILLAVFVVTWKSYEAREKDQSASIGITLFNSPELNEPRGKCEIKEIDHWKEFEDKNAAKSFASDLKASRLNYDIYIWKMKKEQWGNW